MVSGALALAAGFRQRTASRQSAVIQAGERVARTGAQMSKE